MLSNVWAGLITASGYANIRMNGMSQVEVATIRTASAAISVILDGCDHIGIDGLSAFNYDYYNLGNQGVYVNDSTDCDINIKTITPTSGVGAPGASIYETGTSNRNNYRGSAPNGYSIIGASSTFFGQKSTATNSPVFAKLGNYANDAAAAASGVPVGGWYRTGNAVQVRLV